MSVSSTSADPSLILQFIRYGLMSMLVQVSSTDKQRLPFIVFLILVIIGIIGRLWSSSVTKNVPEPYLDEVFHIPQAQTYCDGKWNEWDDKITTPPGLYVLTIVMNRLTGLSCSTHYLRLFNGEIISYLALAAMIPRSRIQQLKTDEHRYSPYVIWTGINMSLFPVLFFFSGLYYTDVISTFVVVLAYTNHLARLSRETSSLTNNAYTIFLGLLALCMRQTNIFWVVVYMGGLDVVHGIKSIRPQPITTPAFTTLSQQIKFYTWRYSLGEIHDPSLDQASPVDLLLCVFSISIATICNLGMVLRRRIGPHLIIMANFINFVAWNEGVVLGDKSNHVATLHLAQMLYIWPLFAFFSAPLFIPQILHWCLSLFQTLTGSTTSIGPSSKAPTTKHDSTLKQSTPLQIFNWLGSCHTVHSIIILVGALVAATLIVRFNTIIHPFTLADNRHYMFYVFRYTILRAWWIRYALVPIYVFCGWLCCTTLWGQSPSPSSNVVPKSNSNPSPTNQSSDTISPPTSTALILLLSAALSLITAPLVEPRYFILPWVFWRLLVPARSVVPGSVSPAWRQLVVLALETAWFLLINVATMYIFITRPFYWRAPDGTLLDGGRVQRFMW